MNDTQELTNQQTTSYSRASRTYPIGERKAHDRNHRLPKRHRLYILIQSALLALLTVAFPLWADFANGVQSQHLYTGMMLFNGQLPYSDIFATGGFLYYVLIGLSYLLGSSTFLVLVQFGLFYWAGIYFYKIIYYLTDRRIVAMAFTTIFYVLNAILGFGGVYPIQFGLPFIILGIWFLTRYFADDMTDEGFILYGISGAFALLLDPQSILFWLLSFVIVIIYNIRKHHKERGFYQLLCMVFGTLLVVYISGYFIFNLQILTPYIGQAFLYPIFSPIVGSDSLLGALVIQLVVVGALGFIFGIINIGKSRQDKTLSTLLGVTSLIYLLLAMFSADYQLYHLLPVLIYSLILLSVDISERLNQRQELAKSRQHGTSVRQVAGLYLNRLWYLPLIVSVLALGVTIYNQASHFTTNQERAKVVNYLKDNSSKSDSLYVWDDTAKVYLGSELKAGSQIVLPEVNTGNKRNQKILQDELLQENATFVVVNRSKKLSTEISNMLSKDYTKVAVSGVNDFKVYRKK